MDVFQDVFSEVSQGRLPPVEVLSLLITRLVGYGIIMFACVIKVPQILALVKSKSVAGLSVVAFELEMFIAAIHTSYGYVMGLDFSAYGEAAVMMIQSVILVACIYWYGKLPATRGLLVYTVLAWWIGSIYLGHLSQERVEMCYGLNQLFFLAARLTQIYKNFKDKDTGQLSTASNFATTAGCVVRIATSIKENAGFTMMAGFVIGTVMNGIVLAQILYYNGKKKKE